LDSVVGAGTPLILTVVGVACLALCLFRRLVIDRSDWGAVLIGISRRLEIAVLAALIGAMILFSALQILLRNVFGSGILWVDPMLRSITLWIGFLGAAFATASGRHIQIDILARISPPAVRGVAARAVSLAAAIVTLILAETAYRHVLEERTFEASGFLDIPSWLLITVIPIAFALMCYRFLYRVMAPGTGAEDDGHEDDGGPDGVAGGAPAEEAG
jgi:TRAP-type C4-dicarboxylate transport system permease small subunit